MRIISKIKVYFSGLGFSKEDSMQNRARTIKIFVALVASMSLGALALMAVDSQSFSEGPFSLATYTSLSSAEETASRISIPGTHSWQQIHIVSHSASAGSIEQLAAANGLANASDLDFHFAIFNGLDGTDGQICATEKWLAQLPALSGQGQQKNLRIIRICVVVGSISTTPTDCQVKRTAAMVESLARKFVIPTSRIQYPTNWQL